IWNGQWKRPIGTAAQYIVLPSQQAQPLPKNTSFAVGACLGIPALTAFQAIRLLGDIRGKTVLVTGASSGVGFYATQLATRMAGAKVIGTVGSTEKAQLANAAGASKLIYYKTESVSDSILEFTDGSGVDAIVDIDFYSTSKMLENGILASHGKIVTYGSSAPIVDIPIRKFTIDSINLIAFFVYELDAEDRLAGLEGINNFLVDDSLSHSIGQKFSLSEIATAHQVVESGKSIGKVFLEISE
ncbi:MAG: zinc-binding dehydrogenase, partial [Rhodospirillales bacterium]